MLPAQLLAAVAVQVFPFHVEIDPGPLALRTGSAYRFQIAVESTGGKKVKNQISITATADLGDVADVISHCLRGIEVTVWQQGVLVTATELDGSPIRRVSFQFNDGGPRPTVRWLPKKK